jgi:Flp pilus assembly CpaE family ATPase
VNWRKVGRILLGALGYAHLIAEVAPISPKAKRVIAIADELQKRAQRRKEEAKGEK